MKQLVKLVFITLVLNLLVSAIIAQDSTIYWGLYSEDLHNNTDTLDKYTEVFDKPPAIVMWFTGWGDGDENMTGFPTETCTELYSKGFIPHVTLEPWTNLDDIIAGKYDAKIAAYGEGIKDYGGPVMLRWGHEFNGDWYPWSDFTPQTFVAAYQHVHDIVEAASGGGLVYWIWCPNATTSGNNPEDVTQYYPGDEYVDWLGIDGYNFGTSQNWSSWISFSDTYNAMYTKLVTNYPDKPIMIGEFACSPIGGDKTAWIDDFFNVLPKDFPNIKAFIWFNVDKETDWRYNSSEESATAFANGINQPIISGDSRKLMTLLPKKLSIQGNKSFPKGVATQTYKTSIYSNDWEYSWSITGDASIQGQNNTDSVEILWSCDIDTLTCEIITPTDTFEASFANEFDSLKIYGNNELQANAQNAVYFIDELYNSSYSWNTPDDVEILEGSESSTVVLNWAPKADTISITTAHQCGTSTAKKMITLSGIYPYPDYVTPHALPGTIASVEFDHGGEGFAYHDADPQNQGPGPRPDEGVDTELNNESGRTIGWTINGEWLLYTIEVTQEGEYFAELRVASQPGGGQLNIMFNDQNRFGTINVPATGGWGQWQSIYPGHFNLNASDTLLKYEIVSAGFNFGNFVVHPKDNETPSTPVLVSKSLINDQLTINWEASTDNDMVLGYQVNIDGDSVTFSTNLQFVFNGTVSNGINTIDIMAIDRQGNFSEPLTLEITEISNNIIAHKQQYSFFPNPVTNQLIVKGISENSNPVLKIYNAMGNQIQLHSKINHNQIHINTSLLPMGFYYLRMNDGTNTFTYKFLVAN